MQAVVTRRTWLVSSAVVIFVAVGIWTWTNRRATPAPVHLRGANLLIVTIDTLRQDRIGAYGSRANLTPTLDTLAATGVRLTRVWSHAPITLPAHASILTGLLPPHHGVRNNGSFRLGLEPPTLAERLRTAGYRTGAFVGAFVLDTRFGLNRGFDLYDDRYESGASHASFHFVERRADQVLDAAVAWIAQPPADASQPWFAWVHLFDPHAPYQPPLQYASTRAPYDGEVAWTDAALGAALTRLRSTGQLDRTLIVVTADHGEALGDHGETTHGLFAYEATLRVPLIMSAPGMTPAVIAEPASHVDIVPTVLDLLEVAPSSALDGRSLRAEIENRGRRDAPPVYFEALDANLTRGWAPLNGLVSGKWKYIDLPEPELYDTEADPGERTNLVARDPERVRALQVRLREWAGPPASASPPVDPSVAARLQSLGYITGSAPRRERFTSSDDPKRLVAMSELFNRALDDYGSGRAHEALDKFSTVLAQRPDFLAARVSAATVLINSGRGAEAVKLLRDAPAADKTTPAWLARMGQALAAAGDLQQARDLLSSAVAGTAGDPEPLNELGVVLVRLGEIADARRTFEQLLQLDPTAAGTWYNVGLLEMTARRPDQAAAAFRRVVEISPRHADAWRGLGAALATTDPTRAIDAWKHTVALEPRDFDTLYNLGMVLHDAGRRAEALPYLRRFLDEAPRDRYAADLPRVRRVVAHGDKPS